MRIGFVLYPEITALDAVGPYEALARLPEAEILFVGAERGDVVAQGGLRLGVDLAYGECPELDVVLVPGGHGQVARMEDGVLLEFLRRQGETARWITSVCTGSLLLGAAGLLRGYRATTHWRYRDLLGEFGATPAAKRIVMDRNRLTAAGVSAGIDMGLYLAALLGGEAQAQAIQLQLEYDPQPPFQTGSPERADEELLEGVEEQTQGMYDRRREQARRLGAALAAERGSG